MEIAKTTLLVRSKCYQFQADIYCTKATLGLVVFSFHHMNFNEGKLFHSLELNHVNIRGYLNRVVFN